MGITDAKKYIGQRCAIRWLDRDGVEKSIESKVYDVTYVPLYGGYLVTDADDVRLDKVTAIRIVAHGADSESLGGVAEQLPMAA